MYPYSPNSEQRFFTLHQALKTVFSVVERIFPHKILHGHRGEAAQQDAYEKGYSTLQYPKSKHNKYPSLAVDAIPFYSEVLPHGVDFSGLGDFMKLLNKTELPAEEKLLMVKTLRNMLRQAAFYGCCRGVGEAMSIPLRGGHDWARDFRILPDKDIQTKGDQVLVTTFFDPMHFELYEVK